MNGASIKCDKTEGLCWERATGSLHSLPVPSARRLKNKPDVTAVCQSGCVFNNAASLKLFSSIISKIRLFCSGYSTRKYCRSYKRCGAAVETWLLVLTTSSRRQFFSGFRTKRPLGQDEHVQGWEAIKNAKMLMLLAQMLWLVHVNVIERPFKLSTKWIRQTKPEVFSKPTRRVVCDGWCWANDKCEHRKINVQWSSTRGVQRRKSVKLRQLRGSVGASGCLCWEEAEICFLDWRLMKHVLIKRSAFSSLSWEKFVLFHLVNTTPSVPSESIKSEINAFLTRDVTDEHNLAEKRKNKNNTHTKKRVNKSNENFSNTFAVLFFCDLETLDTSLVLLLRFHI